MPFFTRVRQLGRAVGQAQRLRVIVGVFLKFGYEDIIGRLPLPRSGRWFSSRRLHREHETLAALSRPERLRHAFEELGPSFVKLGQLLAGRTRMLPRAYTEELAKLQDQVPALPFAEMRKGIEEELQGEIGAFFREVDETPLGSASIAQVHRAWLKDGTEVVLKIQKPNIESLVHTDLEIMVRLAGLLETHLEDWHRHHPKAIVEDFAHRMERELDFSAELGAMERFGEQFSGETTVYVPRGYRALCTRRLLTMERIRGIPASDLGALEAAGLDRGLVAHRLAELSLRQIFVHGFFHGDPHPGNVHVLPGNVVCFLDFGMMGFLVQETRDTICALLVAIAAKDERAATQALLRLASAELDAPKPGLEAEVAEFIHRHFTGPVREIVFLRLLQHLFQLTARHELALPPEVFAVFKALGQVETLVRQLSPELDLLEEARPLVRSIHRRRAHPGRMLRDLAYFGGDALSSLRAMPLEFRRIAAQLRDGKASVHFRVEGLGPLNNTLERTTNRLAFAVVLAALIVASALVIHAGISPQWHGVSIIGLLGYSFAGLMGMALLISMTRHGRL